MPIPYGVRLLLAFGAGLFAAVPDGSASAAAGAAPLFLRCPPQKTAKVWYLPVFRIRADEIRIWDLREKEWGDNLCEPEACVLTPSLISATYSTMNGTQKEKWEWTPDGAGYRMRYMLSVDGVPYMKRQEECIAVADPEQAEGAG